MGYKKTCCALVIYFSITHNESQLPSRATTVHALLAKDGLQCPLVVEDHIVRKNKHHTCPAPINTFICFHY